MKKKEMGQLDKINLLWLLEKISLGNLVRGVIFLTRLVEPVKKSITSCVTSTLDKVKTSIEQGRKEEKQTASKSEGRKPR